MSDLLSAASLLMAVIAIIYSLWYPELTEQLNISPKPHKEDNVAACQSVKMALISKALPLSILALLIALTFLPDAVKIALEAISTYKIHGAESIKFYNAVKMAYFLVSIVSAALAFYIIVLLVKLFSLWRNLC